LRIRMGKGFWSSRLGMAILGTVMFGLLVFGVVFTYYWIVYARMIDQRLSGDVFQSTSGIYTDANRIFVGQTIRADDLKSYLARSGYTPNGSGDVGKFSGTDATFEISPGKESLFHGGNALRVSFSGDHISEIHQTSDAASVQTADIEPELLTNLFDVSREKRRPVKYSDLPKVMINALLAAEDKRFFEHGGFDFVRVFGAAYADLRHRAVTQGASTLDMQVARSFFFTTERTWRRKVAETVVALELNHRFSKEQIFELYANEIYIGNRGSFAIHGFGEAAQAYFGKDIREVNLPEAAFLAGIIRRPNHYSTSDVHPERAIEARDRVLAQMVGDNFITSDQMQAARKQPLRVIHNAEDASSAPYFADMVKDHLLDHFNEQEMLSQRLRVYTTLDPALQRAAATAVDIGMKNVDTLMAPQYAKWKKDAAKRHSTEPMPQPQVAVVVMDPKTGAIKALIGGRDYGASQLNHALSKRQPGSSFKPFVYAAAFDDAVEGNGPILTTLTTVVDEPTVFEFDGKDYSPDNFRQDFRGTVTLREALTHSLNVATIKVAELVGYGHVVDIAHKMGLTQNMQATPSLALGTYEMTPIDVAGGYTALADGGVRAEPMFMRSVVGADGTVLEKDDPHTRPVLDPRVAYLVTNVMQDVVNRGTGYPVRQRGFAAPAAGNTGTSRDGWFAGYTSNLLCVVWVGFDDNRDLGLAGGVTAAPIWAEFMKRAVTLPAYKNTQDFAAPAGVVTVSIDPETLQLATPNCPVTREDVFIDGTQPTVYCEKHSGIATGGAASWLSKIFGGKQPEPPAATPAPAAEGSAGKPAPGQPARAATADPKQAQAQPAQPEKKGLLKKIFGVFGDSDDKKDKNATDPKKAKGPGGPGGP